jgi:tetratricopeptide (TPR) repeat protein
LLSPQEASAAAAAAAERIKVEGNARFAEGEWRGAAECFARSLRLRATAAAHANRAAALLKMGNAVDAEADCSAALALEPSHYKALHRRAQVCRTAMEKWRIVRVGFGTARQKRLLERWTNPKPLQPI